MNVQLQDFKNEHLRFIVKWEVTGEIYNFLSHSRPKCLREGSEELCYTTRLYMIDLGSQVVGCVWLEDLDLLHKVGKLGIYVGEIDCRGMGVGRVVVKEILSRAFGPLELNKVTLHVREKNTRAINCYKSCGFVITKEFPKRQFPDSTYQSSYEMTATKNPLENMIV
jgi:RimJ/RimL family protein N-acetyltransferase